MEMWWSLIYAILATNILKGLQAQDLTSMTTTVTVHPFSLTTIDGVVVIVESTNSLGLTINSTTTELSTIGGSVVTSPQSSPPPGTTSDSQPESTSLSLSTSPSPSTTLLTLPASSPTSTISSFTGLPRGNLTEVHVHEGLTISEIGLITAAVIAVFQGCLMSVFALWWQKRKPFLREPEEEAAWWIHPVYKLRRLLPNADSHTPRRNEPRVVSTAHLPRRTRPKISNPIPIHQRSGTPPLNRPRRPLSLTESLMEDMRTSPQPRATRGGSEDVLAGDVESIVGTDDMSNNAHQSLSPKPLQIAKSNSLSNTSPTDAELPATKPIPIPIPASARSSTSNYGTFLSGLGRPPKPFYLAYSKSDSSPPGRFNQCSLLRYPTNEQSRIPWEDIHEQFGPTTPIGDEDDDDEEAKRFRRDESLRMLEENGAMRTVDTLDDVEEGESASQRSFDFAEARARKVLADKRMREEFTGGQG